MTIDFLLLTVIHMPILTVMLWCILDFSFNVIKIFDPSLSFIRLFLTVNYFLYIRCYLILVYSTVFHMPNFLTVSVVLPIFFIYAYTYQLNQLLLSVSYVYLNCLFMYIIFYLCLFS